MRNLISRCGISAATARALLTAALVGGLSGCGGGDASSGNSSGNTSVSTGSSSVDQGPTVSLFDAVAYQAQRGANRPFTISGSRSDPAAPAGTAAVSLSGSGVLTQDTATPALFDGTPAVKTTRVIAGTLVAGSQATPLQATTVSYADPTSLATMARVDNGVTTRFGSFKWPTAVHIGDSGTLASGADDNLPVDVTTTSYAIARDTSTSVLLTVVDTVSVAGVPVSDVRTVTRIHLDGSAELVSITTERFNLGRLFETVTLQFA